MNTYATDDERVEAIRKWWQENGTAVIAGIVLGIAALVGWKFWTDHRESRAEQASEIYMALIQAAERNPEAANDYGTRLIQDHTSSPYAVAAALELGRLAAERDNLATAESWLRWAMEKTRHPETRQAATLRLARVLVAAERPAEALTLLRAQFAEAFTALVEETRGDAHRALGDWDQARAAYDRALQATGGASDYLQMKRDELVRAGGGMSDT